MWDHGPNLPGNRVHKDKTVFSGQKKGPLRAPLQKGY